MVTKGMGEGERGSLKSRDSMYSSSQNCINQSSMTSVHATCTSFACLLPGQASALCLIFGTT
eukprot:386496-Pelagomonas_calceolata.AAC.1